jgi:hypothetical protein
MLRHAKHETEEVSLGARKGEVTAIKLNEKGN